MSIIGKLIFSVVLIVFIVGVIFSANLLPQLAHKGFLTSYKSIEDVKTTLKIDKLTLPTYFPEDIAWPPTSIYAQKTPFFAIVMQLPSKTTNQTALVIVISEQNTAIKELDTIRFVIVTEEAEHIVKSQKVLIQTGKCDKNQDCSKITWMQDKLYYLLSAYSNPIELLRIAEGMIQVR